MNEMVLRPRAPRRFSRPSTVRPVEALLDRVGELAGERQRLRLEGAAQGTLERNRIEIAQTQWELSYALIARYVDTAAAA
jgi:hypothetical protein